MKLMNAQLKVTTLTLLLAALATTTYGQQAPAPSPGTPTPQQTPTPTPTQRPTFVSQVDLVTLDVIVRDKRGQFVPDLKPQDFMIFEDGVQQSVADHRLFYGGRELSVQILSAPTAAPEGMILPPSRPVADVAGRVFVIFIDDLHLQPGDSPRVRNLLTQITNTLVHDGDLFAIVSTGPSSIEVNPTYDRGRLTESIKKVMGSGMTPDEILLAPTSTSGPQELRHRVHVAFSTAYDLLKQMEKVSNRRKAFVYLSSGYDFNPFTESRWKQEQERYSIPEKDANGNTPVESGNKYRERDPMNPFETGSQAFAMADLVSQLAELVRAANRANATFYTIDPRGLIAGPDINQSLTTTEWRNYVQTSVDSLKTIADLTGGFCICNNNDFKKGLERIDAETSDYYILRYYSSNPDPLRKIRKIEVKTTRPDLVVTHRTEWALPYASRKK
jgi:VWFA-related protein